jgi:hypothetical protein
MFFQFIKLFLFYSFRSKRRRRKMIIIAVSPTETRAAAITSPNNDRRIVLTGAEVISVDGIEACVVNAGKTSGIAFSI